MANHFKVLPSAIFDLEDGVDLNFDLACSFRLSVFENERKAAMMKVYFQTLGSMFTGKKPDLESTEEKENDSEEW